MKRPWLWLLVCAAVLVLTPLVVFPEIMGDVGPRHVGLARNLLGIGMLALAVAGTVFALVQMARARRKESRG